MKNSFLNYNAVLMVALLFINCEAKTPEFAENNSSNHIITLHDEDNIILNDEENKIQVALLLDTSNSMDGLIEQAKSRLWNIINTLTTLKYEGKTPDIEIALYEYGNDGLSAKENYIRQVAPLTQDLDLISEKLFALRTNGGSEYCGAVIEDAEKNLDWQNDKSMKLVYIAGNEPFDQGSINYKESVSEARKNNIYVNTIYCGNYEEGIRTHWKDGADKGNGKYFNIDSDQKVIFITTPYDLRIQECNTQLNSTYIGYGSLGFEKKANQSRQDANAESISTANAVERSVSKTKISAYNNENWDLVDKVEKDNDFLLHAKDKDLPQELRGKTLDEKQKYVAEKAEERRRVQKEIANLSKKRQDYINQEMSKNHKNQDDLGAAIEKSIVEIALANGFEKD